MNQSRDDDGRLLLRLYAAHSALYVFSTAEGISSYLERLLKIIPGVLESEVCLTDFLNPEKIIISKLIGEIDIRHGEFNLEELEYFLSAKKDAKLEVYPIRTADSLYGFIILKLLNIEQFERFDSVINTFAASVSFIIENTIQREHLTEIVKAKTSSLNKVVQQLEEYSYKLERANRELQQFTYIAFHDLQEPLRIITNYLQLLKKRYQAKLDKDADEFINFAVEGAMRLHYMIMDLTSYTQVQFKEKCLTKIDCNKVIEEALAHLKNQIEETHAKIIYDDLPNIIADKTQMVELFQKLLSNAIKFHKPGENPNVHVSAKLANNEWIFSIKDKGIGIDPRYQQNLFIIFKRLVGKDYPGTGTGLAISKKIVERHKGRIWADSEMGKGTTFYFTIPIIDNVMINLNKIDHN